MPGAETENCRTLALWQRQVVGVKPPIQNDLPDQAIHLKRKRVLSQHSSVTAFQIAWQHRGQGLWQRFRTHHLQQGA